MSACGALDGSAAGDQAPARWFPGFLGSRRETNQDNHRPNGKEAFSESRSIDGSLSNRLPENVIWFSGHRP